MNIFVHHGGEKLGPYSLEEAQDLLAQGKILATDLGWHEGLETWIPVSSLPAMGGSGVVPQPPMIYPTATYPAGPQPNGLSIASLVLGISSIVISLGCCLGIVLAIPGVICGHMALGQIRQNPETQSGRGMAVAGLWTGYITTALTVLLPLGFLLFFGTIAGLGGIGSEIFEIPETVDNIEDFEPSEVDEPTESDEPFEVEPTEPVQ